MAKKKYKKPENSKHKPRKDLKDYQGKETDNMVIDASGEPAPDVPRKIKYSDIGDSENMVSKTKDSDIMYPIKSMEDGDIKMPAHAMKTFKKNIEADTKDVLATLAKKDGGYMTQIEKLTKEQKEKLVREIVKRKVAKFIVEAAEKEEPLADTPEPEPAVDAPAVSAEAPPAPEVEAPPAPEPEAPAEPEAEAPEAEAPPAPEEEAPEEEAPEVDADTRVANFVTAVKAKGNNFRQQMPMVMKAITQLMSEDDPETKRDKLQFFGLIIKRAIEKQK